MHVLLEYERNQSFSVFRIIRELISVPFLAGKRSRQEIRDSPQEESQTYPRLQHHRPSQPYNHLAEIVGAGYVFVQEAVRDFVVRLARLAEAFEYSVGFSVYVCACKKQRRSAEKMTAANITRSITVGVHYKYTVALQECVEYLEEERR